MRKSNFRLSERDEREEKIDHQPRQRQREWECEKEKKKEEGDEERAHIRYPTERLLSLFFFLPLLTIVIGSGLYGNES